MSLVVKWLLSESRLPDAGVIQTKYNIVKALGGEIKVETKESEGSKFQITLTTNV